MQPIDYTRSLTLAIGHGNQPRFQIESRTRIIDAQGETFDFIQTAQCKGEKTFGHEDEDTIFHSDSQHGSRIFGEQKVVWYRMRRNVEPEHKRDGRTIVPPTPWGGTPRHKLVKANCVELESDQDIVQATIDMLPLIAQTEINGKNGLKAIIEYPVKTMNTIIPENMEEYKNNYEGKQKFKTMVSGEKNFLYQVDTGPIAFPDLKIDCEYHEERLHLAYIIFNERHFADFSIIQPTPVTKDNKEICQVYHHSRYERCEAQNRIYAIRD